MAFLFDTRGAYRSNVSRHLENIERVVLPQVGVLPYDAEIARRFGAIQAELERAGQVLADSDVQIAATAVHYDLELVTGNLRHFHRIAGLRLATILDEARRARS
jgi:predicted nucleic acid-binding protein